MLSIKWRMLTAALSCSTACTPKVRQQRYLSNRYSEPNISAPEVAALRAHAVPTSPSSLATTPRTLSHTIQPTLAYLLGARDLLAAKLCAERCSP